MDRRSLFRLARNLLETYSWFHKATTSRLLPTATCLPLLCATVTRAALDPHMIIESQESCLYQAREARVARIMGSKADGDPSTIFIDGHLLLDKSLDQCLTVVKWDFTPEFALSSSGGIEDYFAKRFDPPKDFLAVPPYQIHQAAFLLIDFDPPGEPVYEVYDLYIVEDNAGMPPQPPFHGSIIYQDTIHAPYCDPEPEYDGCGYFAVKSINPPLVRYAFDPIWVILHCSYDPSSGSGPLLASDDGPNAPRHPYPPVEGSGLGVHQVFQDSYVLRQWIPGRGQWEPIDQGLHQELHRWNNLCINLSLRDGIHDGIDNLFIDDLTNMSLVLVKPDPARGDSLRPTEMVLQGEEFGIQGIVVANSADSAQEGLSCYGIQVTVTDPESKVAYDVSWVDSFAVILSDSFCVGANFTIYPLYALREDTLGPPWVPESSGEYTITTVIKSWDCQGELSADESHSHDTLGISFPVRERPWTVMVYADGDNDLSDETRKNIAEMEAVGSSDSVNILVLCDGVGVGDTRLLFVEKDTSCSIDHRASSWLDGEENMGDPQTLMDFVQWTTEEYPARHALLVLWDHGHGVWGECDDQTDGDYLTLLELDSALAAIVEARGGRKLDMVAHDACLMGQVEVLYQMASYVDIGIASEAEEPSWGWHYTEPLTALRANPGMAPRELATEIVNLYVAYYDTVYNSSWAEQRKVTQAAVDLVALEAYLVPLVDSFAIQCSTYMASFCSKIKKARHNADKYSWSVCEKNADLYHFATLIVEDSAFFHDALPLWQAADTLMRAYPTVVFAESSGHCQRNAFGMTIWFPTDYDVPNPCRSIYEGIQFARGRWPGFLGEYDRLTRCKPIIVHGYSVWEGLDDFIGALDGMAVMYELWDRGREGLPPIDALRSHEVVIWFLEEPLSIKEESLLRAYLNEGGRLLLTGQDTSADHSPMAPFTIDSFLVVPFETMADTTNRSEVMGQIMNWLNFERRSYHE